MKTNLLWAPSKESIQHSNIHSFISILNQKYSLSLVGYEDLYQFSINEKKLFWSELWSFVSIIGEKGREICTDVQSFKNAKWFPEASLNYAENILKIRSDQIAIEFNGEYQVYQTLTFCELYDQVSKTIQFFKKIGIKKHDRVAILANNSPQTIVCVLAASALGAISSLCSTDFGAAGIIERFSQIEPVLFIYFDSAIYNGKIFSQVAKASAVIQTISSLQNVIRISYHKQCMDISLEVNEYLFSDILQNYSSNVIEFERVSFSHPLYIVYSSGTTGKPKCIVHSHGSVLLQHKKEHILHCDIKENDVVFFYTTCGWMMWQWLVSALASGATLVLYDGSPFYPNPTSLLQYLDAQKISLLGTSAKYIDSLRKLNFEIKNYFKFRELKVICSTGSPLSDENFQFVYDRWKKNVQLSSISGGTDILSCFVLGCPILPVFSGEIQCIGLGMQVAVYDETGAVIHQATGELVCTAPFPSTPVCFWNDPDGIVYHKSYFSRFPNVWCHGDWVSFTENHGVIIYGRSDATLNPGGVRIGTAEIYNQVEKIELILESVVTEYRDNGDFKIVLFVKLKHHCVLDEKLISLIKDTIRANCSPRHVPALICQVFDIPKTRSGKIMELVVKSAMNHEEIKNIESVQNPESLEFFTNFSHQLSQSKNHSSGDVILGV